MIYLWVIQGGVLNSCRKQKGTKSFYMTSSLIPNSQTGVEEREQCETAISTAFRPMAFSPLYELVDLRYEINLPLRVLRFHSGQAGVEEREQCETAISTSFTLSLPKGSMSWCFMIIQLITIEKGLYQFNLEQPYFGNPKY